MGELLAAMKGRGEIGEGRPWPSKNNCVAPRTVISDLGLDRNLSARAQQLAAAPEAQFEAVLAEAKEGERELTRRAVEKLLGAAARRVPRELL